MMWGVAGAFLSVPIMSVIKICCANMSNLTAQVNCIKSELLSVDAKPVSVDAKSIFSVCCSGSLEC